MEKLALASRTWFYGKVSIHNMKFYGKVSIHNMKFYGQVGIHNEVLWKSLHPEHVFMEKLASGTWLYGKKIASIT